MIMKYVKCKNCGKKVYFGSFVTVSEGEESDVFCSPSCYVDSYGGRLILTDAQAHYFGFEVHDDCQRRREIESEIAKLQKELARLTDS